MEEPVVAAPAEEVAAGVVVLLEAAVADSVADHQEAAVETEV